MAQGGVGEQAGGRFGMGLQPLVEWVSDTSPAPFRSRGGAQGFEKGDLGVDLAGPGVQNIGGDSLGQKALARIQLQGEGVRWVEVVAAALPESGEEAFEEGFVASNSDEVVGHARTVSLGTDRRFPH